MEQLIADLTRLLGSASACRSVGHDQDSDSSLEDLVRAADDVTLDLSQYRSTLEQRIREAGSHPTDFGKIFHPVTPNPLDQQYPSHGFDDTAFKQSKDIAQRMHRTISLLLDRRVLVHDEAASGRGISLARPTEVALACRNVPGQHIWNDVIRDHRVSDGLDLVVIADVSGSMRKRLPVVAASLAGLNEAVLRLPQVRVMMSAFADRYAVLKSFGAPPMRTEQVFTTLWEANKVLGGGTTLSPALIDAGHALLARQDRSRRAVVILITDAELSSCDLEDSKLVHVALGGMKVPVIGFALDGAEISTLSEICDGLIDLTSNIGDLSKHLQRVLTSQLGGQRQYRQQAAV